MFRRYLFLALTLMLAVVFVYLVIQSRREAKQVTETRSVEVIHESRPTATRAIAPADIEVAGCTVTQSGAGPAVRVDLRNAGHTGYRNLMVRIKLGAGPADSRAALVRDTVSAGATLSADIKLEPPPAHVAGCSAQVLYADVIPNAPAPSGK